MSAASQKQVEDFGLLEWVKGRIRTGAIFDSVKWDGPGSGPLLVTIRFRQGNAREGWIIIHFPGVPYITFKQAYSMIRGYDEEWKRRNCALLTAFPEVPH